MHNQFICLDVPLGKLLKEYTCIRHFTWSFDKLIFHLHRVHHLTRLPIYINNGLMQVWGCAGCVGCACVGCVGVLLPAHTPSHPSTCMGDPLPLVGYHPPPRRDRPLSIEREPLLLPRTEVASTLKAGDVLVYSGGTDVASVFLGRVILVTSGGAIVHAHRLVAAAVKLVTFLPEWKSACTCIVDGDDVVRRADQKPGYIPLLLNVLSEHFVTSVVIRKNHTLNNDSKKYLEALGLIVDLFSHSCID